MPAESNNIEAPRAALELLDDLIGIFYRRIVELNEQKKLNVKPGDFIKMIELRNRLAPSKSEQQEFWAKIAKIRQDNLKPTEVVTATVKDKKKSKENVRRNENE